MMSILLIMCQNLERSMEDQDVDINNSTKPSLNSS